MPKIESHANGSNTNKSDSEIFNHISVSHSNNIFFYIWNVRLNSTTAVVAAEKRILHYYLSLRSGYNHQLYRIGVLGPILPLTGT